MTYYAILFFVGHIFQLEFTLPLLFDELLLPPMPSSLLSLPLFLSLATDLGMGGRGGSLRITDLFARFALLAH